MIYTIGQIPKIVAPIAQKYHVPAVYLFGSYARGDAGEASGLDLLVDTAGTGLTSLMKLGALQVELEAAFQKPVDLLTVSSLEQAPQKPGDASFRRAVLRERVCLYTAP